MTAGFEGIAGAFSKGDSLELRRLSGELLAGAVAERRRELLDESILAYALSKILTKPHFYEREKWKEFVRNVSGLLEKRGVEEDLQAVEAEIMGVDREIGHFLSNSLDKARLHAGLRLYESGLSLTEAAEFASTSKEELMKYAGHAKVHEFIKGKTISQRVAELEKALS